MNTLQLIFFEKCPFLKSMAKRLMPLLSEFDYSENDGQNLNQGTVSNFVDRQTKVDCI